MRTLTSIEGNRQQLDGGAMFGNAPKALWSRWLAPDEHNRVPLACRALLVREPARTLLFETGIGAFFDPALRERFGVLSPRHALLDSLAAHGLGHQDIDVVVLSHLHFDHAGGLLSAWAADGTPELLFPNATYVVGALAWDRALRPHARDRRSFIPELHPLLEASGRLHLASEGADAVLGDGYRLHQSHGHTPGLLLTEIAMPSGPVVFGGDLIPGVPWVHVPITMGYDRYPELLVDEKSLLLQDLLARSGRLFFCHDPNTALATVAKDARGNFCAQDLVAELAELAE